MFKYDYYDGKYKTVVKVYDEKDLTDPNCSIYKRNNNFGSWKELFKEPFQHINTTPGKSDPKKIGKSKKFLAEKVVKQIRTEFFNQLMTDLIINNDVYHFPSPDFGEILTVATPYLNGTRISTKNRFYRVMFRLTKTGLKKCKDHKFYLRLRRKWYDILKAEWEKGHEYPDYKENIFLR